MNLVSEFPKIFIISLPRTGTKSLSKMLMVLGYRVKHIPSVRLETNLVNCEFDAYADTPIFRPSVIKKFVEENETNKFIYIDRNIDEWVKSFEETQMSRNYTNLLTSDRTTMHMSVALDRDSLMEVFHEVPYSTEIAKEKFMNHKSEVLGLVPKDRLLTYWFDQSWGPLCEFLQKPVPVASIPHINKNNLFEAIV